MKNHLDFSSSVLFEFFSKKKKIRVTSFKRFGGDPRPHLSQIKFFHHESLHFVMSLLEKIQLRLKLMLNKIFKNPKKREEEGN